MPKHNQHNQDVGSSIERTQSRIDETAEVFTPEYVCTLMVNQISIDKLMDPSSTFMDNTAGSGNFLVALKNKLLEYHDEDHIINNMLYAVELMEDNHAELCERVGVPIDHPHYVCANALEYDYTFGQPVGLEAFF